MLYPGILAGLTGSHSTYYYPSYVLFICATNVPFPFLLCALLESYIRTQLTTAPAAYTAYTHHVRRTDNFLEVIGA